MRDTQVGAVRFRIVAVAQGAQWRAHAERADTGDRFGVEYAAATQAEAEHVVASWLAWQADHAAALEALQQAARAYHRVVAGRAFANLPDERTPVEARRASLDELDAARRRLDAVRFRRPA